MMVQRIAVEKFVTGWKKTMKELSLFINKMVNHRLHVILDWILPKESRLAL